MRSQIPFVLDVVNRPTWRIPLQQLMAFGIAEGGLGGHRQVSINVLQVVLTSGTGIGVVGGTQTHSFQTLIPTVPVLTISLAGQSMRMALTQDFQPQGTPVTGTSLALILGETRSSDVVEVSMEDVTLSYRGCVGVAWDADSTETGWFDEAANKRLFIPFLPVTTLFIFQKSLATSSGNFLDAILRLLCRLNEDEEPETIVTTLGGRPNPHLRLSFVPPSEHVQYLLGTYAQDTLGPSLPLTLQRTNPRMSGFQPQTSFVDLAIAGIGKDEPIPVSDYVGDETNYYALTSFKVKMAFYSWTTPLIQDDTTESVAVLGPLITALNTLKQRHSSNTQPLYLSWSPRTRVQHTSASIMLNIQVD